MRRMASWVTGVIVAVSLLYGGVVLSNSILQLFGMNLDGFTPEIITLVRFGGAILVGYLSTIRRHGEVLRLGTLAAIILYFLVVGATAGICGLLSSIPDFLISLVVGLPLMAILIIAIIGVGKAWHWLFLDPREDR